MTSRSSPHPIGMCRTFQMCRHFLYSVTLCRHSPFGECAAVGISSAGTPLESSLPLSPTIAAHAYALRAQARFISASAAANSHSHSGIPDVVHSPEIYETLKENYPPEEFVSWTLPAVVQNNLTIISSPVPAKNSTASAGYKLRRFQPYRSEEHTSELQSPA